MITFKEETFIFEDTSSEIFIEDYQTVTVIDGHGSVEITDNGEYSLPSDALIIHSTITEHDCDNEFFEVRGGVISSTKKEKVNGYDVSLY